MLQHSLVIHLTARRQGHVIFPFARRIGMIISSTIGHSFVSLFFPLHLLPKRNKPEVQSWSSQSRVWVVCGSLYIRSSRGPSWATEPWTNSNRLMCPTRAVHSGGTGPGQLQQTLHSEREKWKPAAGADWPVMFLKLFLGKFQKGLSPGQGGWKIFIDSLDSNLWRVFCYHPWPHTQWVYALLGVEQCS